MLPPSLRGLGTAAPERGGSPVYVRQPPAPGDRLPAVISCQTAGVFQVSDSAPTLCFLGGCWVLAPVARPGASPLGSSASPRALRAEYRPRAPKSSPRPAAAPVRIWLIRCLSLLPGQEEWQGWAVSPQLLGSGSDCSALSSADWGEELPASLPGKGCCVGLRGCLFGQGCCSAALPTPWFAFCTLSRLGRGLWCP